MLQLLRRMTIRLAILTMLVIGFTHEANAQTETRHGVLPLIRLNAWFEQPDENLSKGVLADLPSDPNFGGNFDYIHTVAADILKGYTVVVRGGYFPENQGIPRDRQLPLSDAVYYMFDLDNGNKLILYRTPKEDTSRYFIRRAGTGLLLP